MKALITILGIILLNIPIHGQERKDIVKFYSTDNGLPSNGILGLQWDSENQFLWIATEAGLVRFNGLDFKTFTKENTQEFATNRMYFLVRNLEGNIYTADRARNAFQIKKNGIEFFRKFPGKDDNMGNLFLLATTKSLLETNFSRQKKYDYGLPFHSIVPVNDSTSVILLGNSLIKLNNKEEKKIQLKDFSGTPRKLFKIGTRLFFLNDKNQAFSLDINNERIKPVNLPEQFSRKDDFNKQNHLLAWENGMKNPIFFSGSEAWILYMEGDNLKASLITSQVPENSYISYVQYDDENGRLFIGTDSKGIIVITRSKLTSMKPGTASFADRNAYYGQIELEAGSILTNDGKILGKTPVRMKNFIAGEKFYYSIFPTSDSIIWYSAANRSASKNTLHYYDMRTGKTKVFDKIPIEEQAGVVKYNDRYLIASCFGIYQLSDDSLLTLKKFDRKTLVYDFEELEKDRFIISSCGGLLLFDAAKNRIDTIIKSGDACIRSAWIHNRYIFAGSYGSGFFIWHDNKAVKMPLDRNKYLLYSHCFIPDSLGYLWISTNRGLFRASLEELISGYHNPEREIYYHYYGKSDGMETSELNGGCHPCAITLKNGIISFPSMDGLLWVDPLTTLPKNVKRDLFLDEFIKGESSIDPDSVNNKNLGAFRGDILIRLGFSAWDGKENVYLSYKINNDSEWKEIENDAISLSNLNPGNYRITVRRKNGFGSDNYNYLEFGFWIDKPWYSQYWFYALTGLSILMLYWLFNKIRMRRIKQRQKKLEEQVEQKTIELLKKNEMLEKANGIKNRLISIISHDIITPLKFLNVAGKNLLEKKSGMPESLQRETIEEMTNTSRELHFLSTNILNLIKYQSDKRIIFREMFNLHQTVNEVFSVLNSSAKQKNINLVNKIDKNLQVTHYYDLLRIVIYNLVLNGINFSDSGSITVSFSKESNTYFIRVKDEGIGMTEEKINKILSDDYIISTADVDKRKGNGLGYMIIKDLTSMMRAGIKIMSEPGKGTEVTIILSAKEKNTNTPFRIA